MKGLLSSRRRRRRAGWIGGLLAAAGALTFVGVHWSNTGREYSAPFTNEPVQTVAPNPDPVAFAGQERKAVRDVAAHFVATAVLRSHVDESWTLVVPSLRQGFTRASWGRGEIPVVPYPADAVGLVKWRLDYSYVGRVGLKVAFFAKPGARVRSQTFDIELENATGAKHPHWLVSYWAPAGSQGVPAPTDFAGQAFEYTPPRGIGAIWLLIPVALVVGSMFAVLLTLAVRGRLRRLRAERVYSSTSSPS